MKLLMVGHNYAPEATGIGPYTAALAEHFAGAGHETTVLTTFPHYPRYRWQGKPGLASHELLRGVHVRRLRVLLPRRSNAMWRIAFDSSVGLSTLVNAIGTKRPDVIIAVVPTLQNAYAAGLMSKLWRAPFVLLLKDLPLEAGLAVGMLKRGRVYRAGLRFERRVYAMADGIVVIGDRFRANLIAKGVSAESIHVIPDWIDLDEIKPRNPDPDVRRQLVRSGVSFIVAHTGSMGQKQGLENVVDAAAELSGDRSTAILLVGDGPTKPSLQRDVQNRGLDNISLLGIQAPEQFREILASADALLVNQRADVVDAVVPSKLLTYMAAGRPVIAAVNEASVAAAIVHEASCGVVVQPDSPSALADAIRALSADRDLCGRLGMSGRSYVENRHNKAALLDAWRRLLSSLTDIARKTRVSAETVTSETPNRS